MNSEFKQDLYEMFLDEADEIELIESGEWIENGKYSYRDSIVTYQDTYYMISESRSGSYFTDYHYDHPEIHQVAPRTETVVKTFWDIVK